MIQSTARETDLMIKNLLRGHRIFTIDDFLAAEKCAALIETGEMSGFETFTVDGELTPSYRNNARLIHDDPELAEELWNRAAEFLPESIDGKAISGFNSRFPFYRYRSGEAFLPHFDGSIRLEGMESRLTFLVYLSDVGRGGETRFYHDDSSDISHVVSPAIGKALVFEHEILHEGAAVEEGTKYVLRTDVMYSSV